MLATGESTTRYPSAYFDARNPPSTHLPCAIRRNVSSPHFSPSGVIGVAAVSPRPAAVGVTPAHISRPMPDVLGPDAHQDDALVALKSRRHHVHPAVVGVVVPRPALGVAAVQVGGKLGVLAHVRPRDAAVVGAPDLGPDDVAETAIDDGVQVNRVVDAQQVGRDDSADAAAGPAGGRVIVDVVPQLAGIVRVVSAGPLVDDFVVGVAGADQHDGRTPVALRRPCDRRRCRRRPTPACRWARPPTAPRSVHVTPQRSVSPGPVRSTTLPLSSGTAGDRAVAGPQALTRAPAH